MTALLLDSWLYLKCTKKNKELKWSGEKISCKKKQKTDAKKKKKELRL